MYGGDEFLLLGTCREDRSAEQLKCAIEDRIRAYNKNSTLPVQLGMSIGTIVTWFADEVSDIDYYISQSDRMMYQMKKRKKGV